MSDTASQAKMMAWAVYEVRLLLGGYLGSGNTGDIAVRRAAHLAYALHNEALAVLEGGPFDAGRAAAMEGAADAMLGSDFGLRFREMLPQEVIPASGGPAGACGPDAEPGAAPDPAA